MSTRIPSRSSASKARRGRGSEGNDENEIIAARFPTNRRVWEDSGATMWVGVVIANSIIWSRAQLLADPIWRKINGSRDLRVNGFTIELQLVGNPDGFEKRRLFQRA